MNYWTANQAKSMSNVSGYQYGHPSMYGSSGPVVLAPPMQQSKGPFVRGIRQRLNFVAMLISLFVPWLIFCFMFWTMSFSVHYKNRFICFLLVCLGLCIVLAIGIMAMDAMKKKHRTAGVLMDGDVRQHEPTWLVFLFATSLLAWLLGVIGGDINFVNHMEPFYDLSNLNTYPNVDPSVMRGQQLMDAGRIMFTPDSKLDLTRSMGFKNQDLYCVAPITSGEDPKHIASYDFWAVGTNCCSGMRADFHCGEFNNPHAAAGIRLMRDDQRAYFRLAVQQAEAAYNIKADHPLFFHWMRDPIAEVMAYSDEGLRYFLLAIFTHFLFQLFLVAVAALLFSKLGTLA